MGVANVGISLHNLVEFSVLAQTNLNSHTGLENGMLLYGRNAKRIVINGCGRVQVLERLGAFEKESLRAKRRNENRS